MPHAELQSRILELRGFCSSVEKYNRLQRNKSEKIVVTL
jgi:hypothetical protein